MKELLKFEDEITYHLGYGTNSRNANRALNKHYSGKEEIPLTEIVPDELKKAAWNVHMVRVIPVIVSVFEDGSVKLEIKNDESRERGLKKARKGKKES